jgi:hypothetical protein
MSQRLKALFGSIAHGIRASAGSVLSLVGLRRLEPYVVPALVVVLVAIAAVSARDTAAIIASRPEVTQATLREVAEFSGERGESIWFQFDGLVDSTSFETDADFGTFFYLARDPESPDRGIIVRSGLNDGSFRQRVLGATIVDDPDVVAAALDALAPLPTGFDVDEARFLDEVEAGGDPEAALVPSDLADEPAGSTALVTGRIVTPATYAACAVSAGCDGDDAAWFYLLADPQAAEGVILRSPHPPTAIPVALQGLFLRASFDLGPVIESEWLASHDVDVPQNRALTAGSRPPITVEASWVPTILYAVLALLLLISHLIGYPVFRAEPRPAAAGRSLAPGGRIDADITGRIARDDKVLQLDRSPGALERLTIGALALLLWRYGLLPGDQSRREAEEAFVAQAAGQEDRLVIHERDQSALVIIDREPGAVEVRNGRLHRVAGSVPAVRFRQGRSEAFLATRTVEDRDRLAAEIAAEVGEG